MVIVQDNNHYFYVIMNHILFGFVYADTTKYSDNYAKSVLFSCETGKGRVFYSYHTVFALLYYHYSAYHSFL